MWAVVTLVPKVISRHWCPGVWARLRLLEVLFSHGGAVVRFCNRIAQSPLQATENSLSNTIPSPQHASNSEFVSSLLQQLTDYTGCFHFPSLGHVQMIDHMTFRPHQKVFSCCENPCELTASSPLAMYCLKEIAIRSQAPEEIGVSWRLRIILLTEQSSSI